MPEILKLRNRLFKDDFFEKFLPSSFSYKATDIAPIEQFAQQLQVFF